MSDKISRSNGLGIYPDRGSLKRNPLTHNPKQQVEWLFFQRQVMLFKANAILIYKVQGDLGKHGRKQ